MRKLLPAAAGLLISTAFSFANGDDGPELTPPSVAGSDADSGSAELPKVIEARPAPAVDNGAVLVVPGLTTPRPRQRIQPGRRASIARDPAPVETGQPAIVGPAGAATDTEILPPPIPAGPRSLTIGSETLGPDGRPPLTLESVPTGDEKSTVSPPASVLRGTRAESSMAPRPRRTGGLFGRLLSPSPVGRGRGPVTVVPRVDAEEDDAIRARIDTQIRENLGTSLKSYELRVVGREVTLLARVNRFWQKRAIRNALENLPALKGYKTRIDVTE